MTLKVVLNTGLLPSIRIIISLNWKETNKVKADYVRSNGIIKKLAINA